MGISNVSCKVIACTNRSEDLLSELLSEENPNAPWTSSYQNDRWDGIKRFYNRHTRRFPSGLLPIVLNAFAEEKIKVVLVDLREGVPTPDRPIQTPAQWTSLLRSRQFRVEPLLSVYQHRAVTNSLTATLPGTNIPWLRGLISGPTGFGKTVSSFWLMRALRRPALYLIDRQDLFLQSIGVWEQLTGKEIGKIGMGVWDPRRYTIAIIKTLSQALRAEHPEALRFLQDREVVVVDEAHMVKDNWYTEILDAMPNASARFAVGGSMLRRSDLENWPLLGTFGDVLYHLPSETLRRKGLLAKVRGYIFDVRRPKTRARYAVAEKQVIHRNEYRNGLAIQVALRAADSGWVTLLLVAKRDHGDILKGMFKTFGLDVPFLCYKDPAQLRQHYLDEMRTQRSKIVIASGIFKVGIDVPLIRCLIRLDGGLSAIDSLQIPGRGMRRKEEFNWLYLIDFVDHTSPHFLEHSQKRLKVYRAENYELEAVSDPEEIPFKRIDDPFQPGDS